MMNDSENWYEDREPMTQPVTRRVVKTRYRLKKEAYPVLIGTCFIMGGVSWGFVKTAQWGTAQIQQLFLGGETVQEEKSLAVSSIPLALTNPEAFAAQQEAGELAPHPVTALNLEVIPQGAVPSEPLYTTQSVNGILAPIQATTSLNSPVLSDEHINMSVSEIEWVEGESSTERNGLKVFFTFTNQSQSEVILGNNHAEEKMPILMKDNVVLGAHTQGVEELRTKVAPELGYSATRYLTNYHVGYTEPEDQMNCNTGVVVPPRQNYTCYQLVDDAGVGTYWVGFPTGDDYEWAELNLTHSDQIIEMPIKEQIKDETSDEQDEEKKEKEEVN